jgi:hypothetical protein
VRCNQLADENAALLRRLDEQQRESYVVAEHFRSEVLAKNAQIAQLQVRCARRAIAAHMRARLDLVVSAPAGLLPWMLCECSNLTF